MFSLLLKLKRIKKDCVAEEDEVKKATERAFICNLLSSITSMHNQSSPHWPQLFVNFFHMRTWIFPKNACQLLSAGTLQLTTSEQTRVDCFCLCFMHKGAFQQKLTILLKSSRFSQSSTITNISCMFGRGRKALIRWWQFRKQKAFNRGNNSST